MIIQSKKSMDRRPVHFCRSRGWSRARSPASSPMVKSRPMWTMAPSASCPVFMDIHCHGAYEFDTNDAKPEGLRYWAKHIVSEGVTSFLATTVTQSVEVLTNAVANVADVMEGSYEGAEILGIHFEGPYLDMKYKGAQPPEYIAKPSVEQFKHYQQAARGPSAM